MATESVHDYILRRFFDEAFPVINEVINARARASIGMGNISQEKQDSWIKRLETVEESLITEVRNHESHKDVTDEQLVAAFTECRERFVRVTKPKNSIDYAF